MKNNLLIMKPILFNTKMVKALLDDRKSTTRRIVKLKYDNTHIEWRTDKYGTQLVEMQNSVEGETFGDNPDGSHWHKLRAYRPANPPYKKGDVLYVRETWSIHAAFENFCMMIKYKADGYTNLQVEFVPSRFDKFNKFDSKIGWISSLFMPKEAARIFLNVTDVRVERLQALNNEDALKEGLLLPCHREDEDCSAYEHCTADYKGGKGSCIEKFINLWDSTVNKSDLDRYGWNADPYVWVIEFERTEKPNE